MNTECLTLGHLQTGIGNLMSPEVLEIIRINSIVAGLIITSGLYSQCIIIFKTRSASNLSSLLVISLFLQRKIVIYLRVWDRRMADYCIDRDHISGRNSYPDRLHALWTKEVKMNWSPFYRERVRPNIGILTETEQEKLRTACVGIAGCGAVGGHAAADLAYWGIGHLKLAEFDVFETSNANRQLFAAFSTIGKPKVKVISENLKDISPDIQLDLFKEGITFQNVDEFTEGCDLILDAIDYESPKFEVALHRAARKRGIPVFVSQCIGFGASMFAFYPDSLSYETYLGIDENLEIEDINFSHIDIIRLIPIFPDYVDQTILNKVILGEIEAPTVITGQTIAVGLTVTEMILQLTKGNVRRPLRMCALDCFKGELIKSYELPAPPKNHR